jgi:hypothetical protein
MNNSGLFNINHIVTVSTWQWIRTVFEKRRKHVIPKPVKRLFLSSPEEPSDDGDLRRPRRMRRFAVCVLRFTVFILPFTGFYVRIFSQGDRWNIEGTERI